MKNILNRKKIILLSIMTVISIFIVLFVYNDYFLYKTPILKIKSIDIVETDYEKHYIQKITGVVMNGEYKGKTMELENIVSTSGIYSEEISNNDELFLDISSDGNVHGIIDIKRDKYIVTMIIIFIDLIIFIAGKVGVKTLISLFINILITAISIILYKNNNSINILALYYGISILYIVVTLSIINKLNRKTISAMISSFITLTVILLLSIILLNIFNKEIPYGFMNYIDVIYDYKNYLCVGIILCGLGAIMDVSITMAASINELIEKDNNITKKALIKSGKEISKDITGTMINVMLYTVYVSVIPTILIAAKNGISLMYAISYYGYIELVVILISCIGIVITVPIAQYISIYMLMGKKAKL